MSRWLALAVIGVMLVVPAAGAASWTQPGHDHARTGSMDEPGPAVNDTAFELTLPGRLHHFQWVGGGDEVAEPLVHEGYAYVPVIPADGGSGSDARGIVRVDLDTARSELFIELEDEGTPWAGIAIAGDHLLVPGRSALEAYELETGQLAWKAPLSGNNMFCQPPAVGERIAVVACGGSGDDQSGLNPEVWAVDLDAHEGIWRFMPDPAARQGQGTLAQLASGEPGTSWSLGVSFSDENVLVVTLECRPLYCFSQPTDATTYTLWNLDIENGEPHWSNRTQLGLGPGSEEVDNGGAYPKLTPAVTATPRMVYANLEGTLQAINPLQDQPYVNWDRQLGEADAPPGRFIGPTSALADGTLYAASTQSVYRFDAETGAESWRVSVATDEELVSGSLIVADGTLYTLAHEQGFNHSTVYAFDAETGAPLWSQVFEPRGSEREARFSFALGDGVLVVAGTDGSFHVIGRTEASLGEPDVDASTAYPPSGEQIRVDLSGTDPGALGNATRYRADWGDGNATGWRLMSTLTHVYETPGEQTARFWVANEDGQTTSTTHTFHVDEEAPTEPNLIETAFQRENQDLTFGVLGVVMAVGGGAIGAVRRKRKQATLEEELETLEKGFEETRESPGECEAFLETRKARARSLLMDGDLTEEQFGVIESRIVEMGRELRTSVLDERFQFLPYGMVQSLKKMLADGRISGWEREAFETLLEDEHTLSDVQKERVRTQLDQWFTQDARGEER